jgi:Ca2+-binding EF-hand superfamily protein
MSNSIKRRHVPSSIKELFLRYDTDGSGEIDSDELAKLLGDLGVQATPDQVRCVQLVIDRDNSGLISTKEFFEWYVCLFVYCYLMCVVCNRYLKMSFGGSLEDLTATIKLIEYLDNLFKKHGHNTGRIPLEKFDQIWTEIYEKFRPGLQKNAILDAADTYEKHRVYALPQVHIADILDWLPCDRIAKVMWLITKDPSRIPRLSFARPRADTNKSIPPPPPPPLPHRRLSIKNQNPPVVIACEVGVQTDPIVTPKVEIVPPPPPPPQLELTQSSIPQPIYVPQPTPIPERYIQYEKENEKLQFMMKEMEAKLNEWQKANYQWEHGYLHLELKYKEALQEIFNMKNRLTVANSNPSSPRSPARNGNQSPRTPRSISPSKPKASLEYMSPRSKAIRSIGYCWRIADSTFPAHIAVASKVIIKPVIVAIASKRENRADLGRVHHFDLDKNVWSALETNSKQPAIKKIISSIYQSKHQSIVVFSNSIVSGSNVWEYDVYGKVWKSLPPLSVETKVFGSVYRSLVNTFIVFGDLSDGYMSEYNFSNREWRRIRAPIAPVKFNYCSVSYREDIDTMYITGGDHIWAFNFEILEWKKLPVHGEVPFGLNNHGSAIVRDRFLFIAGGTVRTQQQKHEDIDNTAMYMMDLTQQPYTWIKLLIQRELITPRLRPSLFYNEYDGRVYVMGGKSNHVYQSDLFAIEFNLPGVSQL